MPTRPFSAYRGGEPFVFVCYAHADSETVYPDLTWLREQGVNVWYDEGIPAGTEWRDELAGRIKGAALLVFFVSEQSITSENCRREANFALDEGVPVLTVMLDEAQLPDGMRLSLGSRQSVQRAGRTLGSYRNAILEGVERDLGRKRALKSRSQARPRTAVSGRWIQIGLMIGAVGLLGVVVLRFFVVAESEEHATELSFDTRSVAVLPIEVAVVDPALDAVADAIYTDVLDHLSGKDFPKVTSRRAATRFRSSDLPLEEIARQLEVGYLVESNVRRDNENVRFSIRMVRALDGFHVWSEQYDFQVSQSVEIQEVALNASHNLRVRVLRDEQDQWYINESPFDSEAVYYYLEGWREYREFVAGNGGSWQYITDNYLKATELDPTFGVPFFLLANSYRSRAGLDIEVEDARRLAYEALNGAEAASGMSEDVLLQLGEVQLDLDFDYRAAEKSFSQCLELSPGYGWCRFFLALTYAAQGKTDAARRELTIARGREYDYETGAFSFSAGFLRFALGDYFEARELLQRALEFYNNGFQKARVLRFLAWTEVELGNMDVARALTDRAWSLTGTREPYVYIHSFSIVGDRPRAKALFRQWNPETDQNSGVDTHDWTYIDAVNNFQAVGEYEKANEWLIRGIDSRDLRLVNWIRIAQHLEPLRQSPGFQKVEAHLSALEQEALARRESEGT